MALGFEFPFSFKSIHPSLLHLSLNLYICGRSPRNRSYSPGLILPSFHWPTKRRGSLDYVLFAWRPLPVSRVSLWFGTVISCAWVHNTCASIQSFRYSFLDLGPSAPLVGLPNVNVLPNVAVLTKGGVPRHARSLTVLRCAGWHRFGTLSNAADLRSGRTGNWRMRPFSRDLLPIQFRTFLCHSPGPR
jgi:hypothetical protein